MTSSKQKIVTIILLLVLLAGFIFSACNPMIRRMTQATENYLVIGVIGGGHILRL